MVESLEDFGLRMKEKKKLAAERAMDMKRVDAIAGKIDTAFTEWFSKIPEIIGEDEEDVAFDHAMNKFLAQLAPRLVNGLKHQLELTESRLRKIIMETE